MIFFFQKLASMDWGKLIGLWALIKSTVEVVECPWIQNIFLAHGLSRLDGPKQQFWDGGTDGQFKIDFVL